MHDAWQYFLSTPSDSTKIWWKYESLKLSQSYNTVKLPTIISCLFSCFWILEVCWCYYFQWRNFWPRIKNERRKVSGGDNVFRSVASVKHPGTWGGTRDQVISHPWSPQPGPVTWPTSQHVIPFIDGPDTYCVGISQDTGHWNIGIPWY